jgi:hypothetical protein
MESFRLKVPDVVAELEEQSVWSQYQDNLGKLSAELMNIKFNVLSEKAKYYLSANSEQRKKEIIHEVLEVGIN